MTVAPQSPSGPQDLVELNLNTAVDWISILHGASPGLVHLCAFGDWEGRSFDWATESEQALDYIKSHDQAQGIYLRVTTLRHRLAEGRRGSDTDSLSFPGLWADMDLAGPGHKTRNTLPEHFEDAALILERALLPQPSVWIHSGGGLYPMWLLTQTHQIESKEDLEQLSTLSAKWQEVIAHAAKECGFHYGTGVGDLARVLRLPGTVNRKEGLARPCRILDETWGPSYSLDELKMALLTAVEAIPEPVVPDPVFRPAPRNGLAPGDDYENRTSWAQILEPTGAQWSHRRGQTDYWVRPGKDRRDGHSATTGHDATRDRLFVMSTEWLPFPAWEPITKFHAYALLNHNGDHKAAARELGRQGYGDQSNVDSRRERARSEDGNWSEEWAELPLSGNNPPAAETTTPRTRRDRGRLRRPAGMGDHTISGAASRFVRENGHLIRYVTEEKTWRVWDGVAWMRDDMGADVSLAFEAMTEDMVVEAERLEKQAETDDTVAALAKSARKHATTCRNTNRANVLNLIANQVRCSASEFDADPRYLNLENCVYDLAADTPLDHDPKYMLTKVANVSYDPNASAGYAEKFFESVLPSDEIRDFTLQALGYTLTGEADAKALFLMQGPSNSGKTQVSEMMQTLLGDYAVSVSPGTFTKRRDNGPNAELHDMRGARMVYTSETSHDIALDEELIKRVTGKDTMTTRTLYEKPQRWIPQCAVWIATNNLPRLSSDEEAMWRRVKTIRFPNVFTDDGSSGFKAVHNIGRKLASTEGAGIFNLLLAALRRYRQAGSLLEPQELKQSVADHRRDTDPVAMYIDWAMEKRQLVEVGQGRANMKHVHTAYAQFCAENGYRPLSPPRFGLSLRQQLKYERLRSNGDTFMIGWEFCGPTWASSSPLPFRE